MRMESLVSIGTVHAVVEIRILIAIFVDIDDDGNVVAEVIVILVCKILTTILTLPLMY